MLDHLDEDNVEIPQVNNVGFLNQTNVILFDKSPQDPEFVAIQTDWNLSLQSYDPYLDEQDLLLNVDSQVDIAKRNDDIASLRSLLNQYKPLYQSVAARKDKIDKCITALNDTKIAKTKLKGIPAASITPHDLDQWQVWNDIETTCTALLAAHEANITHRQRKKNKMDGIRGEQRMNRKRARDDQQQRTTQQEQGDDEDSDDEELVTGSGGEKKKNPNDDLTITENDWQKGLSSAWKHRTFSGPNKFDQGLVFFPPNMISCNVCNKSNLQWRRIAQHICGKKHRDRLDKWRVEQKKGSNINISADGVDVEDESPPVSADKSEEEALCSSEVVRLHQFFVDWFTGAIPKSDANFKRVSSALSSDFHIVSPRGHIQGRTDLLQGLVKSHGSHEKYGMIIEIKNCRLISTTGNGKTFLMTYEEWQRMGPTTNSQSTARIATVVFRKSKNGWNGLEWLHVHETWMPGKAPPL